MLLQFAGHWGNYDIRIIELQKKMGVAKMLNDIFPFVFTVGYIHVPWPLFSGRVSEGMSQTGMTRYEVLGEIKK